MSHLLLTGLAVSGTALASASLALVTGTVLYAHIVTDVVWDIQRLRRRPSIAADEIVPSDR
ncbi:hypothetical protein [Natronococcus sp.]|uniref:hypothetical protein n=1 Tax=Natronococcus sp. TaxID=35747 RepID=UPI0031B83797